MSIIYTSLRTNRSRRRISERLLRLRNGVLADVRAQRSDSGLLLATWNLRDFDGPKFGWEKRSDEALFYIAEIISCFDLVAIQEVKQNLTPFRRLIGILGPNEWDYLLTDVTSGRSGNGERMAFLFRRSKVWFRKIASEVVLPTGQEIVDPANVDPQEVAPAAALEAAGDAVRGAAAPAPAAGRRPLQFARSPYLVAFQSGWFHFSLCTVHIYYGDDSGPQLQRRIGEIRSLVKFFADRQDNEVEAARDLQEASGQPVDQVGRDPSVENYILLGDFNVVSPEHETMKALTSRGFKVPEPIDGDSLDASMRNHFYDQIAARIKDDRYRVTGGGFIRVFDDVYRDDDFHIYHRQLPTSDPDPDDQFGADTPEEIYRKWRTWQMSDHSPLWVRIETDFADDYLTALAAPTD